MKKTKKLFSTIIASITLISSLASTGTFSTSAANTKYKTTNTMELEFEIVNNYAVLTNCTSKDSVITVPQTIYYTSGSQNKVYPVKTIAKHAFLSKTTLKEIKLPKGLEKIESDAFYGCSNLNKAIIPYTVTSCGKSAFAKCTNLKYIFTDSIVSNSFADTTNIPNCKNLAQNRNYKMGDMNRDGFVDIADANLMLDLYTRTTLVNKQPTIEEFAVADVNRDGTVSPEDYQLVFDFYIDNMMSSVQGYAAKFPAYSASYSKPLPYNVECYRVVKK